MTDAKKLAKMQLSAHIEPTRERLTSLLTELSVVIELMERSSDDFDLCNDKEYQGLACLYCDIESAVERYNRIIINKDKL